MIKYVVFDFDGTIADTFPVVEKIGKEISKRYSLDIDSKEARKIGFKKALLKSKFPMWRIPQTVIEIKKRMSENVANNVEPIKNIKPILISLSKKYELGVLSSNSKENVETFLKRNKLHGLFQFILSDSSIFGKHIVLKKLCKKLDINVEEIVYIGDEDRDIEAANKMGIKNIAVSWGFNSESTLKKVKPNYIVSQPDEILKILSV